MKLIRPLILLFVFVLHENTNAQLTIVPRHDNPSDYHLKDHIYFGGGFGLQFGTRTYIEIAPVIGYKITEKFSAGLNLKYIYYKYSDDYETYKTNIYGGGPFCRYFVADGLFLQAEYESLNLEVPDFNNFITTREFVTSVFIGGGYRQMMGTNSALDLMLLYNLNYTTKSPYADPYVIRMGFVFGI